MWLLSRTIMRTSEAEDAPSHGHHPTQMALLHLSMLLLMAQQSMIQHNQTVQLVVRSNITTSRPGQPITHSSPLQTSHRSQRPAFGSSTSPRMADIDNSLETDTANQLHGRGPDRKTVITLDMALYERAKLLEMSRDDCKGKWVLRLGEMHTVMAALRAAGNAIEDSGLDEAWSEADIYGPTTTRQIIESKHMKRALEATHHDGPSSLRPICGRVLPRASTPQGPVYSVSTTG